MEMRDTITQKRSKWDHCLLLIEGFAREWGEVEGGTGSLPFSLHRL